MDPQESRFGISVTPYVGYAAGSLKFKKIQRGRNDFFCSFKLSQRRSFDIKQNNQCKWWNLSDASYKLWKSENLGINFRFYITISWVSGNRYWYRWFIL